MIAQIRKHFLIKKMGGVGDDCKWDPSTLFKGDLKGISLERGFSGERNAIIENHSGGKIQIGHDFRLGYSALIISHGGKIEIGSNCSLNPFSIIYGHGGTKIGNFVRIAAHTVIIPANHIFSDPETPISKQGLAKKGIQIGDDVWIGARCIILDGVKIGSGSVIGAGSIVTSDIPPFSIAIGTPARVVGQRGKAERTNQN